VISGDIGAQLAEMKTQPGKDIVLSAGPETLGPLASQPGLVDEYLLWSTPRSSPPAPDCSTT
jgi:hypothetical protein